MSQASSLDLNCSSGRSGVNDMVDNKTVPTDAAQIESKKLQTMIEESLSGDSAAPAEAGDSDQKTKSEPVYAGYAPDPDFQLRGGYASFEPRLLAMYELSVVWEPAHGAINISFLDDNSCLK